MTQQLVFDLPASYPPTLDNFVPGRNAECLQQLRRWVEPGPGTAARQPAGVLSPSPRVIYLWGQAGSGKTHLIRALRSAAAAQGRDARTLDADDDGPAPDALFLIDDVQLLDTAGQDRLFAVLNRVRAGSGQCLLATGDAAPAALPLRADLTSRLAWGLVYPLQPLSDDEKLLALQALAAGRGLSVAEDVLSYLLTHGQRDMRALTTLFDALDRYALARSRALTLPLLRDYLRDAAAGAGSGTRPGPANPGAASGRLE